MEYAGNSCINRSNILYPAVAVQAAAWIRDYAADGGMSGGRVRLAAGTLYGALNTLCDKGWIALKAADEDSRRKEYMLTDKGREILVSEVKRLKELARNGEMILREEL